MHDSSDTFKMFGASIGDHFGAKLLSEVLTHFSEFAPHSLQKRGGRTKAEPQITAWTEPSCIERPSKRGGRNFLRKYLVNAADRGKDAVYGRPGTAVSPSMFSDETMDSRPNSRADTPCRDRLPRSAQQFPILVESRLSPSCMHRPSSQQSQVRDSMTPDGMRQKSLSPGFGAVVPGKEGRLTPVPFRHSAKPNLLERQVKGDMISRPESRGASPGSGKSPSPRQSPRPPVGRRSPGTADSPTSSGTASPDRAGSKRNFRPNFIQREGQRAEGKSPSPPRGRKSIFHRLGSTRNQKTAEESDEDGSKKTGIWTLNLVSSKYDRMERLNNTRKLKLSESQLGDRDKVCTREEIELAEDSFNRNFKTKMPYDKNLLVAALADFGIRARTRPEKLVLFKVFDDYHDRLEMTFKDFCSIVEEARVKIRTCRFTMVFLEWRRIDKDDIGSIDHDQILQLLEALNLAPKTSSDTARVEAGIEALNKDSFGLFPLAEVEYLVQQCREHVESDRRRVERHIQKRYEMSPKTFNEFRGQLIDLHETFERLDEDSSGTLSIDEVMHLLSDFGIVITNTMDDKQRLERDLLQFIGPEDAHAIRFPWFLLFMKSLRKIVLDEQIDGIRALFRQYDKDKSGELDMKEVCHIIQDMNLQPRTAQEQDSIAELLEEVDADGSGCFHLEELMNMIVRISERIQQLQRQNENARAQALKFTFHQTYDLRQAFEFFDVDGSGTLTMSEVQNCVKKMQWKVDDNKVKQLVDEIDEDRTGTIDFLEFLELMSKVDADMKSIADERAEELARAKELAAKEAEAQQKLAESTETERGHDKNQPKMNRRAKTGAMNRHQSVVHNQALDLGHARTEQNAQRRRKTIRLSAAQN